MNGDRLTFSLLLALLLLAACVEEPGAKDGGALWDQYVDELTPPDKDAATDATLPADGDDAISAGDDDLLESPDGDAFVCMEDPCVTHDDCKKPSCVATFCSTVLGALAPDNPNVCAMRCDPVNNGTDCPDGLICDDRVQLVPQFDPSIDIDGAKGICSPPSRR